MKRGRMDAKWGSYLVSLLAVLLALGVSNSEAANRTWTNKLGGFWHEAGNWNPNGTPTNTDRILSSAGDYVVEFNDITADTGSTNTWLTVNDIRWTGGTGGDPTLLFNFTNTAVTFTTLGTTDSMEIREGGRVTLSNGNVLVSGSLILGTLNTGILHIAGGTFTVTNGGTFSTSVGVPSTLNVSGGRFVSKNVNLEGRWNLAGGTSVLLTTASAVTIGNAPSSTNALLAMTGGTLLFTNTGSNLRIGNSGHGTFQMSGGTLDGYNVLFGDNPGGRGEWYLTGGHARVRNNLTIVTQNSSTGILEVANAGVLELGSGTTTIGGTGTGRGYLTNRNGGTLRFTGVNNPSITVNAGSTAVMQNATLEFKDTSAASLSGNITKITHTGDNTLSLNHASNSLVASYTFQANNGQNFAFLKLSNGGAFLSTATTVDSGGLISGDGLVSGSVEVKAGGSLLPGDGASFGTLTVGSGLTLQSNSILRLDLGASQYDQVAVIGGVSLSNSILQLNPLANITTGVYVIVDNDGFGDLVAGMFQGLTNDAFIDASANGFDAYFRIQYNVDDGNNVVLFATIPEPSMLAALGLAGLLFIRRR